jgi:hypothetical protein
MKNINDIMPNRKTRFQHNLYNNQWAKRNRYKANFSQNKWQKKRMDWYLSLKIGKSCEVCGENHPACLDFHHNDKSEKIDFVRRLAIHSSNNKRVLDEIKKCKLICANCHRKVHYKPVG